MAMIGVEQALSSQIILTHRFNFIRGIDVRNAHRDDTERDELLWKKKEYNI